MLQDKDLILLVTDPEPVPFPGEARSVYSHTTWLTVTVHGHLARTSGKGLLRPDRHERWIGRERKEATSERDFQTWAIAREEGERLLKGQMSASLRGNRTCYVRA